MPALEAHSQRQARGGDKCLQNYISTTKVILSMIFRMTMKTGLVALWLTLGQEIELDADLVLAATLRTDVAFAFLVIFVSIVNLIAAPAMQREADL